MRDIDYQLAVMQAFKDGKKIECVNTYLSHTENWWIDTNPTWDWYNYDYRVKEEPKYIPYKNTEELIEDFCERSGAKRSPMGEPFIWIKGKTGQGKNLITDYDNARNLVELSYTSFSLTELFEQFTYLDGSPIGKKVE